MSRQLENEFYSLDIQILSFERFASRGRLTINKFSDIIIGRRQRNLTPREPLVKLEVEEIKKAGNQIDLQWMRISLNI